MVFYFVSVIVDIVVCVFYELLNVSFINLYYDKDNKINMEIWIDWKKIIFILSNILFNVYWYILYFGFIYFIVNISIINGKDFCFFIIEDDGKEMIEEFFVIFFGLDNYNFLSNWLYFELGIEIMKMIILVYYGDI